MRDAQGIQERAHQRSLMAEVIRDERAGRDRVTDVANLREMPRAPLDRKRLNAPRAEIEPPRQRRDRFHLLHVHFGRIAIEPERLGREHALVERHVLPDLRRTIHLVILHPGELVR